MRFIKWTFGKAKESQLRVMSPLVFSGLRRLIRENAGNSDEAVSMKVLACTAMVPLCKRLPSLFCTNFPGKTSSSLRSTLSLERDSEI